MGLALIMLLSFSCNSPSKTNTTSSSTSLQTAEQVMSTYVEEGKLSGISVLTLKDGEILHQFSCGFANIEENRPMKEETIFRIYSMSKPITAAALMILFDEGEFQLDDPVTDYIPGFSSTKVWVDGRELAQEEAFTIRHLLTHTAGFCYGWAPNSHVDSLYSQGAQGGIWSADTLEGMINLLATIPLKNQPGSKWEYSVSIDVAGYLVEVLSGLPFDDFLQTRVFDPLKMGDTGFQVDEQNFDRLAMIYSENGDSLLPVSNLTNQVKEEVKLFSGGGGLVSTISDYARFGQMLLNGGALEDVRILEESTVKLIMSDQMPSTCTFKKGMGYGLGGQVNLKTGAYSWSGMASTYFVADPKNNMVVLAFTQYISRPAIPFAAEYQELIEESLEP